MTTSHEWRRSMRRLLIGGALAAGVMAASAVPASAATTATFSNGELTVNGDSADNTIVLSRDAAGKILVNNGAVAVIGGTPTVANTALIRVFGLGGNDTITLSEANGALPAARLFGGAGNDVLTGGSGADQLFGQAGNDALQGKAGADSPHSMSLLFPAEPDSSKAPESLSSEVTATDGQLGELGCGGRDAGPGVGAKAQCYRSPRICTTDPHQRC